MKKVSKLIQSFALIIIIVLAISLALSTYKGPGGFRLFSVQSGSMTPSIPVGSLVVVNPSPEYVSQDVITFQAERDPNQVITHRVVEVVVDEDLNTIAYRTQGDANEDPDPELVNHSRVLGKVSLSIPWLGYLTSFARTTPGFVLLIVIPATLIIYSESVNIKNELLKLIAQRKSTKIPPQSLSKKSLSTTSKKAHKKSRSVNHDQITGSDHHPLEYFCLLGRRIHWC